MNTDLTFITNEPGANLLNRFRVLIKDARFFDSLVGYFYTSGFYKLYPVLEKTEKIRILIGIGTGAQTIENIKAAAEAKEEFSTLIASELEESEDAESIEAGVQGFIDWIKSGKLEIRAYPAANIHAKVYIITFKEGDRDVGRVITGSSNFSQKGLVDNLEFNVELKTVADYRFAQDKFNQLWKDAVDVSEKYIETVNSKTWLNNTITPYELYLKFLYEYFKDQISQTGELFYKYVPERFMQLEYQEQAVLNAKRILEEYGGVFLSDVVGLGKTYISAMLASQLDGRSLVIAPPVLLDRDNPGSWPNVFSDFREPADFESLGKLDKIISRGTKKYKNVFIDEAHRFRTETNITYEKLAQICRGKRVILVTATPYNNAPKDILSQLKLFQKAKKSAIPNLSNLELFFSTLEKRLKGLDRQGDRDRYLEAVKRNAKEIREKILKYLMVRRTRSEVKTYFAKDLGKQGMKFPEVEPPKPLMYQLNDDEDEIFNETIQMITQKFKYARYMPMTYYTKEAPADEVQAQKNLGRFMKILMVKRLESSFYAFRQTLKRFIHSYELFLNQLEEGFVFTGKRHINKVFELLDYDDDDAVQKLIDEGKVKKYPAADFSPNLKSALLQDLAILKVIIDRWRRIKRDPKLLHLVDELSSSKVLKSNKILLFTESKETALYLKKNLDDKFPDQILTYHGSSGADVRNKVIENFDARVRIPKDDFRILISTEVLSEGVNLHRSNVVVNYDIPWNPTRLMQRVGRVNRVDTKHDKIYTFNFFPTRQSNDEIKLNESAESKIEAFIELLGNDAKLLTEGEEIKSHSLWVKLTSRATLTGEDETGDSELKYLAIIRDIRDKQPDLFENVKRLPKKARTGRKTDQTKKDSLLTYFRKVKLQKFFLTRGNQPQELDFLNAAKLLEANQKTLRHPVGKDYYRFLSGNKLAFQLATTEETQETSLSGGRSGADRLVKILKSNEVRHYKGFTDEDESYLKLVIRQLEEGGLPKQTVKSALKQIDKELSKEFKPLKLLAILKLNIAGELLQNTLAESAAQTSGPREVILSEYLIAK